MPPVLVFPVQAVRRHLEAVLSEHDRNGAVLDAGVIMKIMFVNIVI
jgi:hypothetical protein